MYINILCILFIPVNFLSVIAPSQNHQEKGNRKARAGAVSRLPGMILLNFG
jgi:hypothetical protein